MKKGRKKFINYEVPDPVRIRKVLDFVHEYFQTSHGLYVLECGATKGGLADAVGKDTFICYGIDINARSIPGVHTIQADLNHGFPQFERPFDVIFAGEIIEHLLDDVRFVKSCFHILKPGGLLIITVPNLVFSVNRVLMLFGKMPLFAYTPYHYHIYTKKTLKDIITMEGFQILKFSSSHILFSTRRNRFGKIFEKLGDIIPSLGAHLIVYAKKP